MDFITDTPNRDISGTRHHKRRHTAVAVTVFHQRFVRVENICAVVGREVAVTEKCLCGHNFLYHTCQIISIKNIKCHIEKHLRFLVPNLRQINAAFPQLVFICFGHCVAVRNSQCVYVKTPHDIYRRCGACFCTNFGIIAQDTVRG